MKRTMTIWILFMGLSWVLPATPRASSPECQDPLYLQFAARIEERNTAELKMEGWRTFLHNHPDNPCIEQAKKNLVDLEASSSVKEETKTKDAWQQESRGGVIEPGRDDFAAHMILTDVVGRRRVRLVSEVIWLADELRKQWRLDPEFHDDASALWTQIIRAEFAPLKWLGVNLDLPAVAASLEDEGFAWALGNMSLGLRGIWGRHLADGKFPWVISGGFIFSPGTSAWAGADKKYLLDAAAFGAAHVYHLFRYDAPDYVFHAESQLGLGAHFFSTGLAYHLFSGGGQVEKIYRIDLAWDWRVLDWLSPGLALLMAAGQGETGMGGTGNDWYFFCQLSPQVRARFGGFVGALAFRVPLGQSSKWSKFVLGLETGWAW